MKGCGANHIVFETNIALLLAAAIAGLIGGMQPGDVVNAISQGFGNTLASTGIIIGLAWLWPAVFSVLIQY